VPPALATPTFTWNDKARVCRESWIPTPAEMSSHFEGGARSRAVMFDGIGEADIREIVACLVRRENASWTLASLLSELREILDDRDQEPIPVGLGCQSQAVRSGHAAPHGPQASTSDT